MNRSVQLSVFLLPLLFACSQKQPETPITPAPISSSAAVPAKTAISSAPPVPSSPFSSFDPGSPAPAIVPTPARLPGYQTPSSIPIIKTTSPLFDQTSPASAKPTNKTDSKKAAEVLQEPTITPDGIGRAKVGMTLGELKQALGATAQFTVKENFAANYNAIAVIQQGKVQYYIPYPQESDFGDRDRIRFLLTDNPSYQTGQGVRPGMPIKKAAALYGPATLTFSREATAQEIVKFANQPKELVFRSQQPPGQDLAGIYPESNDDELETDKYADQSKIRSIIVSCKDEVCGEEH